MALIDRDRLVCIGKVVDAHGLKGEMRVRPASRSPRLPRLFESCEAVILDTGRGLRNCTVRQVRFAGGYWVLALEGVDDRESARDLKGAEVLLPHEGMQAGIRPAAEGGYGVDDLIGCDVLNLDGEWLGQVSGLIETGANDVLEVATGQCATLVPVTEEVVKQVDVAARRILIDPLPGLFPARAQAGRSGEAGG